MQRTGEVWSREVAYADHVPIFEAAEQGDVEAARTAMAAHMEGATRRACWKLSSSARTPDRSADLRGD